MKWNIFDWFSRWNVETRIYYFIRRRSVTIHGDLEFTQKLAFFRSWGLSVGIWFTQILPCEYVESWIRRLKLGSCGSFHKVNSLGISTISTQLDSKFATFHVIYKYIRTHIPENLSHLIDEVTPACLSEIFKQEETNIKMKNFILHKHP